MGTILGRDGGGSNEPMEWPKAANTADVVCVYHGLSPECASFPEEHVLLVRRKNEPFKDHWALPGGFVNQGEEPLDAAARELLEETSYAVKKTDLIPGGSYISEDPRGWTITSVYVHEAPWSHLPPEIKAADDALEVKWIPLKKALELVLAFNHDKIIVSALSSMAAASIRYTGDTR